ncbi:MAG: phenylalanine--tRNA ligase subunit alpha [Anaerolineae bacterium]|nr:phenylalanine--tRNA ligase subunit alpha [Anaerolineae bacterium]MDW8173555.1 phenylalanine--tRNA ligase subunit alpha [Anaerolineae bacterium]
MSDSLQTLTDEALHALEQCADDDSLQAWKVKYLGQKGVVRDLMNKIASLPVEERKPYGLAVNGFKEALSHAYEARLQALQDAKLARDLEEGALDITMPGRPRQVGGLHPSTQTLRQIYAIWADMGFQVYKSRDVEDDDTNFTLLNIPPHHPARDMQDTFYTTEPNIILRTHTSPGQIRAMRDLGQGGTQPIRVILPGMCYRYEQITPRSEVQFHQVEGLVIGRNIRMSDLKGTITAFARRMFGEQAAVRFRASYFPFTEPSMEIDVECFLCDGQGCRICKHSGWLEIAGSGMVHPTVLRNGGYDPTQWSGFAFGMGPERMTILKHGIEDIRYFWANDIRFLEQF